MKKQQGLRYGRTDMVEQRESVTAKLCAFARAWHSNKVRQKIYDDYLAYDMMGKEEYDEIYALIQKGLLEDQKDLTGPEVEAMMTRYIAPIPLCRLPFTENRLKQFAEKNKKVQYVICGAGSDTFSFRNTNPQIEIFEIDHPDTQRYKLEKIKKLEWNIPQNVHFVSVDFEKEKMTTKLEAAGFDKNRKTFFSILGVSYYLKLPTFTKTLSQIAEFSVNGNVLVFDYPDNQRHDAERVKELEEITRRLGEEMQGGFDYGEVSRALYSLGFQIDTYLPPEKVQSQYFSGREDGLSAFENVHLVSATYTGGYDYE